MQQDRQLSSHSHHRSLLGIFSSSCVELPLPGSSKLNRDFALTRPNRIIGEIS
jgi:hypothetical protein